MMDKVKANWLIIELWWEGYKVEDSVLVLGTFDDIFPIGLLHCIQAGYRIELWESDADGKMVHLTALEKYTDNGVLECIVVYHETSETDMTKQEVFAVLDAYYGRDVWLAELDNDARRELIKQGWLDD